MKIQSYINGLMEALFPPTSRGIETGLLELDEVLEGFKNGQLYLLCSYEGVGTTSMLIQWISNILQAQNRPTAVTMFSIDNSAYNITERLIANFAKIDLEKIRTRDLKEQVLNAQIINDALTTLRRLPLYIDDSGYVLLETVEEKICLLHATGNADIVFIDHLEHIANPRAIHQAEHFDNCLKRLKALSISLNIPIVVVAKLKEDEDNKRPFLREVRQTINENHSTVVMCQWNPDYYDKQRGEAELLIVKNNLGKTGKVQLLADFQKQTFTGPTFN